MRFGTLTGVACLLFAAVAGFWAAAQSWKGTIYVTSSYLSDTNRDPAAINKKIDFSVQEGLDFLTSNKERLLTAAKMIVREEDVGVEFGHFLVEGADGKRKPACQSQYNWITLRFEAEGVAESGEKPSLEIESPCRQNEDDFSRLATLWIPVDRILGERPTNMDLSYPDQQEVNFKFDHMTSEWPMRWTLHEVRLSREKQYEGSSERDESVGLGEEEEISPVVSFAGSKLRDLLPYTFTMNWKR